MSPIANCPVSGVEVGPAPLVVGRNRWAVTNLRVRCVCRAEVWCWLDDTVPDATPVWRIKAHKPPKS